MAAARRTMRADQRLVTRGRESFTVAMWRFGTISTMQRRLRVDVVEGEHLVVFVDLRRGNLAGDDAAEAGHAVIMTLIEQHDV